MEPIEHTDAGPCYAVRNEASWSFLTGKRIAEGNVGD